MRYTDPQPTGLTTFRDTAMRIAPKFLQGVRGGKLMYSLGIQLDCLVDALVYAVRLRMPNKCAELVPSALPAVGRERGIVRGLGEPDVWYAARLTRSIDDHRIAGSPFALMAQLQGFLAEYDARIRVWTNCGFCFTLNADGTKELDTPAGIGAGGHWDWDGDVSKFNRFWVVIYDPTLKSNPAIHLWESLGTYASWSSGETFASVAATGETVGFSTTYTYASAVSQASSLETIVRQWTPPHAECNHIIISLDPDAFKPGAWVLNDFYTPEMPDSEWAEWHKVDILKTPIRGWYSRNQSARYIYVGPP